MTPYLRLVRWAALTLFALSVGVAPVAADSSKKIDRAVRQALAAGASTQRVLVTVKPGYRDALNDHGDVIKSKHRVIEAVAADLHSDTILFATAEDGDNIVWGTADTGDKIIWGTAGGIR